MRIKLLIAISISVAAFAQGPQVNWNSQIRNMPVIDVRTYGADPTGTTDSTTAFQNAVNAAQNVVAVGTVFGGAKVLIPNGTYKLGSPSGGSTATPVSITTPISFVGAGSRSVVLRKNAAVTAGGNLIALQLGSCSVTNVTWASTSGGQATYTCANRFSSSQTVAVSGLSPSGYNLTAATNIVSATSTQFVVAMGSNPGSCSVCSGVATIPYTDTSQKFGYGVDIGGFTIDLGSSDTVTTAISTVSGYRQLNFFDISAYYGFNAMTFTSTSNTWVRDFGFYFQSNDGIQWTQNSPYNLAASGENHISDGEVVLPGKAGFEIIKTALDDTGGVYLTNVHVNGASPYGLLMDGGATSGYLFSFVNGSKFDSLGTNVLISNASWTSTAGGTLTVTTAFAHPYKVGWPVAVWGIHDAGADGKFNAACAIATVPSSTSFTCTGITNPASAFSAGTSASVTAASCSSGDATYTASGTYTANTVVTIAGITPSSWNQNYAIVTTGGTGSFHVSLSSCPGSSYSSGGTVYSGTNWGKVSTGTVHAHNALNLYFANNWINPPGIASTVQTNVSAYADGAGPAIILDAAYVSDINHNYISCCGGNGQNGYAVGLFNAATQTWFEDNLFTGIGYYFAADNNHAPVGLLAAGDHAQQASAGVSSMSLGNSLDMATLTTSMQGDLGAPMQTGLDLITNSGGSPNSALTFRDLATNYRTSIRETNGVQLGVSTWPGVEVADVIGGHVLFDVFNNGWIWIAGAALTDSALSSCGTSPHIFGSVAKGFINVGSGATACTVTWASGGGTAPPFAPICMVSGAGSPFVSSASTSALTIGGGSGIASTRVNYLCVE